MRLDLYQAETARIAAEQSALLAQAKAIVQAIEAQATAIGLGRPEPS